MIDEHRKLAQDFMAGLRSQMEDNLRKASLTTNSEVALNATAAAARLRINVMEADLAELLCKVRLEEAKWWSNRMPGRLNTLEKERIAALGAAMIERWQVYLRGEPVSLEPDAWHDTVEEAIVRRKQIEANEPRLVGKLEVRRVP